MDVRSQSPRRRSESARSAPHAKAQRVRQLLSEQKLYEVGRSTTFLLLQRLFFGYYYLRELFL